MKYIDIKEEVVAFVVIGSGCVNASDACRGDGWGEIRRYSC
jgi:hypothetical protein